MKKEMEMEKEMEKEIGKEKETFDAWMHTQKDFMDTWMRTQKQVWDNVTESTKKMQESFMQSACSQAKGGPEVFFPKDAFNIYNTMVETMFNSTKAYADEAVKMQEAWNRNIAKQMEMCMRMASNMFEMGQQKKAA